MKRFFIFNRQKGTTLIELVVVLAIFITVISTAITLFLAIVSQQSKVLAEQDFLNEISYMTDYISRAVRTAQKDTTGSCTGISGADYVLTHYNATVNVASSQGAYMGIKFLSINNVCTEFYADNTNPASWIINEVKAGGTPQNILSTKYTVVSFYFFLNGDKTISVASENDTVQPRVSFGSRISLKTLGNTAKNRYFSTTISQRNLNIK